MLAQEFSNSLAPEWKKKLQSEFSKTYFTQLCHFLESQYQEKKIIFPAKENILRALHSVDYPDVRVVLLGQDPYHGAGQAIGLSFAVPNDLFPKPPSLKNIFKEIKSDLGVEIPKEKTDLTGWTEQGVLLLNAVLTVEEAKAAAHQSKGWETFTDRVIQHLNEREKPVVFLLWGNYARKKKDLITNSRHFILEEAHPSPLSASRGFLGCRHFSAVNGILTQELGSPAIDWGRTVKV